MASVIPAHKDSSSASSYVSMAPPPSTAVPVRRCAHYQSLTLDTSSTTAKKIESDTPPMTPVGREGDIEAAGSLCSCSIRMTDDGYQLLEQSVLTPPRTPMTGTAPQSFKRSPPKSVEKSITSSRNSSTAIEYVLVDSSTTSTVSSFSEKHLTTAALVPVSRPFAPEGTFKLYNDSSPYGFGAWSTVYRALFIPSENESQPIVIAVKKPSNEKAVPILKREAAILSYLSTPIPTPGAIPLLGFDEPTTSLLLPAHPLTLESFVRAANAEINSEENISLSTLRCPVVRMQQWLLLAKKLCEGFVALKKRGVVHGDVKWANILLREYVISDRERGTWGIEDGGKKAPLYEPIIVDFSSSHIETPGVTQEPISAITVPFCAPELLEAFSSPAGHPVPMPTFASDLYSVAITLLTAAIGSDPYSVRGASDARKGLWVKCGDPVGFARGTRGG
ncbi:kinase-like domain-containing protein [Kalaharituber pfeilii]|nr:kinase-like domain-containing protein [Kalaharituber pfeilii]